MPPAAKRAVKRRVENCIVDMGRIDVKEIESASEARVIAETNVARRECSTRLAREEL
jgi:hypothetical protein